MPSTTLSPAILTGNGVDGDVCLQGKGYVITACTVRGSVRDAAERAAPWTTTTPSTTPPPHHFALPYLDYPAYHCSASLLSPRNPLCFKSLNASMAMTF
jgi:hypothetical protein